MNSMIKSIVVDAKECLVRVLEKMKLSVLLNQVTIIILYKLSTFNH